jgi:cysteine synthase A
VIVIPETQSQEKKDALRLCGADLIEVPAVPYKQPQQLREGVRPARRGARRTEPERRDLGQPVRQCRQPPRPYRDHRPGNLGARPMARWMASSARSGPAARSPASRMALKERNPKIQHRARRSDGRRALHYYTHGELKSEGSSITEGIGQGRITANLEGMRPSTIAYQIRTSEALPSSST